MCAEITHRWCIVQGMKICFIHRKHARLLHRLWFPVRGSAVTENSCIDTAVEALQHWIVWQSADAIVVDVLVSMELDESQQIGHRLRVIE